MGKPILYFLDWSPPSRAVLLTAKAIGLDVELKIISLMDGDHLKPDFLKINPQHTIPMLDDNGEIIIDSHAICEYICDKYGGTKYQTLFPKDLVKRAEVNARLHFDTGYLFARFRFMFEPIIYRGEYRISDEKLGFMQRCWPMLEGFLENQPYLCGNNITVADYCCVATIKSMDKYAPIDTDKYPNLLAWLQRMTELPEYVAVNGVGGPEFQTIIDGKILENKKIAEQQ